MDELTTTEIPQKILELEHFNDYVDLRYFINENGIKQEDIQAIIPNSNNDFIWLYYWTIDDEEF